MGIIPGCIYGGKLKESLPIQIAAGDVQRFMKTNAKGSALTIELEDKKYNVLLKDIDENYIGDSIIHLGFQSLVADEAVNSVVRVEIINKEKNPNLIQQIVEEIPYSALPSHLVERITIDVDGMEPGKSVRIEDLDLYKDENIKISLDPDTTVLNVVSLSKTAPSVSEEAEDSEEATEE